MYVCSRYPVIESLCHLCCVGEVFIDTWELMDICNPWAWSHQRKGAWDRG